VEGSGCRRVQIGSEFTPRELIPSAAANLFVQSFGQADFKNMLTIKASFAEILHRNDRLVFAHVAAAGSQQYVSISTPLAGIILLPAALPTA